SVGSADNKGLTGSALSVTQLVSPVTNTSGGAVGSPVPVVPLDGSASTADMRLTPSETADLLRAERAVGEGAQGGGEKTDSGLRAEGRGFSSLLSAAAQVAVPADQVAKMTPTQTAFTLAGQGQMGSAPWSNALSERIMIMTAQNNQVAEIQLDPPELGSLKVRLQVGQDQVSVSFVSPHASVRDAVEQSMPRLREMLEQQGLNLGESSVNDQSSGSEEERRQERFASGVGDELSGGLEEQVSAEAGGEGLSLVDYYA
ncbi:flagellar hook-length control protein FliK, partial [Pontibacterium sp.]|uniref:flagellar hook-length control protein FliK n=1 Tax=Pontibacterium sp. TaxID=2036026 RepID=UPI00356A7824